MVYILSLLFIIFLSIILIRSLPYKKNSSNKFTIQTPDFGTGPVKRLSQAIQIRTVSYTDPGKIDKNEFRKFHNFCEKSYPMTHKTINKKKFNEFAVLYTWKGTDDSLKPIMLCSHFDVVPSGDDARWEHPPFSGAVKDNYIWGRGAQDVKISLIAIFEAIEVLIKQGFKPARTIFLAFGGDEEISGRLGAAIISEYLEKKNIELEYLLDEGGLITENMHEGIDRPIAHVAFAEKGNVNVVLSATSSDGGHASMPGRNTASTILCNAVSRLNKNPFPARFTQPYKEFLKNISNYSPWTKRVILSNLWFFAPLLKLIMSRRADLNAHIRTTTAVTMLHASDKENVISPEATANVNVRILPGETIRSTIKRIRKVINDANISVEIHDRNVPNDPVGGASIYSHGFAAIKKTLTELIPDVIVAPTLLCASTDSKKYAALTKEIFRFTPVRASFEDIIYIHGDNERISVNNLKLIVSFYFNLIINSCS